jgi:hypothetical protein
VKGGAVTEEEWLACADIAKLLKLARARPNGRKIRLLVCEWCNRRWNALDERYQRAIEIAGRFADGQATDEELSQARRAARGCRQMYGVPCAYARSIQYTDAVSVAGHLAQYPYDRHEPEVVEARKAEKVAQLAILHDIFGTPFRPVAFFSDWRTDTTRALARQMYESRDFGAMPILADALQEAGCDSEEVLSHCRDPKQVHVRGCWVVDLVLGKP